MEPFQPVLEILKQLEEEDPKLAFQAARLVGLYRRLWESCVSKHVDSQQIEAAYETAVDWKYSAEQRREPF